jgi:hypothetical protein
VKAGGLQALLANYLKHNKEVFKQYKQHLKKKQAEEEEDDDEESSESEAEA